MHVCKLPKVNQKTISFTVENSHRMLRRFNNKKNLELSAKQQICIFFSRALVFQSSHNSFSSLSLRKVGSEALVMFAEPVTTAVFGSQTKSTAGAQAYQIYSKHSSEKGQSAAAGMLIIRYSASRAGGRKRDKRRRKKCDRVKVNVNHLRWVGVSSNSTQCLLTAALTRLLPCRCDAGGVCRRPSSSSVVETYVRRA